MRAYQVFCSNRKTIFGALVSIFLLLLLPLRAVASGSEQLQLDRSQRPTGQIKGVVDLSVNPDIAGADVTIAVDGQKVVQGLRSPYHASVDFGPHVVQHDIKVPAETLDGKRVQWHETINSGHLPLSVKVRPVDVNNREFEVKTTAPQDDPVQTVQYWDGGKVIASLDKPPYRFVIPADHFQKEFVQVTAKTKSGDEAADFWTGLGDVDAATEEVRTVPLYVSVVDGSGNAQENVDRSLFRIIDNGSEGKILEFSKAFDQPISIALVLDASSSMAYSMDDAEKAAESFVQHTLKQGDRCTIMSVRGVPRSDVALTTNLGSIDQAIKSIHPGGQTALYDAIDTAIRELKPETDRKAIVVLTDGGDNASIDSFDDIDRNTKEADIPLYIIAYDTGEPAEPQELDRLNYLAGETGGFLVTATADNLNQKYGTIEKDLRAQYAILYQISGLAHHNQWRRVRVLVDSPRLTARTIRGYFAP